MYEISFEIKNISTYQIINCYPAIIYQIKKALLF